MFDLESESDGDVAKSNEKIDFVLVDPVPEHVKVPQDENESVKLKLQHRQRVTMKRIVKRRNDQTIKNKATVQTVLPLEWISMPSSESKSGPLGSLNRVERRTPRGRISSQKSSVDETTRLEPVGPTKPSASVEASPTRIEKSNEVPPPLKKPVSEMEPSEFNSWLASQIRKTKDPQPSTSKQALANDAELEKNDPKPRTKNDSSSSTSSSSDISEDQYEVENIVDYVNSDGGRYLIKWKGWEVEHNTWEPIENLVNCDKEILRFYNSRIVEKKSLTLSSNSEDQNPRKRRKIRNFQVPPDPRPIQTRMLEFLTEPIGEQETADTYLNIRKGKKIQRWEIEKVNKNLELAKDGGLTDKLKTELRVQLVYIQTDYLRAEKEDILKRWEVEINAVSQGMPKISVINEIDLAGPPIDFVYVNDYTPSEGITIPDDPPVGCLCESKCFQRKNQCCPQVFAAKMVYTQKKKLFVEAGTPIYECNKKCKCGPECPNRVVQDGVKPLLGMAMSIFRTNNGCGWGVKTLKLIKRGTYVCMYVGEIINTEEAERRGREYDHEGCTYLFDLDINEDDLNDCPFTVDAAKYGNISHFMNHSCDPNLTVYNVWVNCLDPNLPKLALFANRDIHKNEELSFDYKSHKSAGQASSTLESKNDKSIPLIKRKPCLCGSKNCRKILF